MSQRESSVTPRSLAVILNPDVDRPAPADPGATPDVAGDDAIVRRQWRNLRERVFGAEGKIEVLMFRVASESFALPLESVREAIDAAERFDLPDMPSWMDGVMNVAGRSLPLYASRAFLGVAPTAEKPSVLIVKGESEDAGLVVDSLVSSADVELSAIKRVVAFEDAGGAFVGVFFREGELVTLLDPASFTGQRGKGRAAEGSPNSVGMENDNAAE